MNRHRPPRLEFGNGELYFKRKKRTPLIRCPSKTSSMPSRMNHDGSRFFYTLQSSLMHSPFRLDQYSGFDMDEWIQGRGQNQAWS